MKRVEESDILFAIDEKIIFVTDFTIKFYTVNERDFFIAKSHRDVVDDAGVKYIKLDWQDLYNIGRGVMQFKAVNNIQDYHFPDHEYNKNVQRTTNYYINSSLIVDPPSDDKSIMDVIDELRRDLQNEIVRALDAEEELENDFKDYIPKAEKAAANGVATLNGQVKVPVAQLQFPTRGQIPTNINSTTLEDGVYEVNGKTISSQILNGAQANGIFIQYPWASKLQVLHVGRSAGHQDGEQVETYLRRYLSTPQRWTDWVNLNEDAETEEEFVAVFTYLDQTNPRCSVTFSQIREKYVLREAVFGTGSHDTWGGTYILASCTPSKATFMKAQGSQIFYLHVPSTNIVTKEIVTIGDSIDAMTQEEATQGTSTTPRSITAKVLADTIAEKVEDIINSLNITYFDNP